MRLNRIGKVLIAGLRTHFRGMSLSASVAEVVFGGWILLGVCGVGLGMGYWGESITARTLASAWLASLPGAYLIRLTLSVLFGWPLTTSRLCGHLLASRPFLMLLLVVWCGSNGMSVNLYDIRLPLEWVEVLLMSLFLLLYWGAFWLIVFFPYRYWSNARSLRVSNKGWPRRLFWYIWDESIVPVVQAGKVIVAGLRAKMSGR